MCVAYTSDKERAAVRMMEKVLASEPRLRMRFMGCGVEPERLSDPDYADYMGDLLAQELGDRVCDPRAVRDMLVKQSDVRTHCYRGCLRGTILDRWEEYPLEAFLRMIWRNRNKAWQMRFLKGDWWGEEMPDMWHLEVRQEGDRFVLHCSSYADGSYLQTVLSGDRFAPDYREFGDSMRQFLDIPRGTVWLSGVTTIRMEEEQ